MPELNDLNFPDFPVQVAHEFEVDLNCVVAANHRFALDAIDRTEQDEIGRLQEELSDDSDTLSSALGHLAFEFEMLRQASRQLAMVGVITRLQHWIQTFVIVGDLDGRPQKCSDSKLVSQLEFLNNSLGCGPIETSVFENLVNIRDSIIHHDSQVKWNYNGKDKEIASDFTNHQGCLEIKEEQLEEAIRGSIRQITWYDEHLPQKAHLELLRRGRGSC